VQGADRIARFFIGSVRNFVNAERQFEVHPINGWPALVGTMNGTVEFVVTIETDGDRITAVLSVVNPDKLRLPHID
jgi:RNA polymerase sigma-70 factor (ECF subfamily)